MDKRAVSTLHPSVLALYLLSQIALGMFIVHPVFVAVSCCFALILCCMICGRKFGRELKFYLPFFFVVALTNPLFSHNGATPLFFWNGKAVTLEATLYGINAAGMIMGVLFWFRAWNEIMTSEKLLYLVGKKLPKVGMVLTVSLRMIPRFRMKWKEIREVQTTLGAYVEKGFVARIKQAMRLFSALVSYALESSVETGMSMAARGYGVGKRKVYALYRFDKRDAVFMAINVLLTAGILVCAAMGGTDFAFYPTVSPVVSGRWATGGFVLFALQSALLPLTEVIEEIIWKYSQSKI